MMTVPTRLKICAAMIVLSMVYGVIVMTQSTQLATVVGVVYLAIMGTGMTATNVWKHHDR